MKQLLRRKPKLKPLRKWRLVAARLAVARLVAMRLPEEQALPRVEVAVAAVAAWVKMAAVAAVATWVKVVVAAAKVAVAAAKMVAAAKVVADKAEQRALAELGHQATEIAAVAAEVDHDFV